VLVEPSSTTQVEVVLLFTLADVRVNIFLLVGVLLLFIGVTCIVATISALSVIVRVRVGVLVVRFGL
jgi:hypothetical protein